MDIINFVQFTDSIASSGQPSKEDFVRIAALGYNTVINLALVTSDNAIVNEGDLVTKLGMSYLHIPIEWERPTLEQFQLFATIMEQQSRYKVWVHCALNMRVSAFLYLYNRLYLNTAEHLALQKLNQVWQPNKTWSQFITKVKNAYNEKSSYPELAMKTHSIAGFATITKNSASSMNLYKDLLGLPLKSQDGYSFTEEIPGCHHFGVCSLSMAAQFCFGQDTWPKKIPEPSATLEFELNSTKSVGEAVEELKANGQAFIHDAKVEPWGQTVARFISPENILIGLCYTPQLHTDKEDQ